MLKASSPSGGGIHERFLSKLRNCYRFACTDCGSPHSGRYDPFRWTRKIYTWQFLTYAIHIYVTYMHVPRGLLEFGISRLDCMISRRQYCKFIRISLRIVFLEKTERLNMIGIRRFLERLTCVSSFALCRECVFADFQTLYFDYV